jgi:hypothetical protein
MKSRRVDDVCLPAMVSDTGDGLNIDDTTSAAYAMCETRFKKSLRKPQSCLARRTAGQRTRRMNRPLTSERVQTGASA